MLPILLTVRYMTMTKRVYSELNMRSYTKPKGYNQKWTKFQFPKLFSVLSRTGGISES